MSKSYRNADTEMRAHFDQMQTDVAGKVDEAMASFRDQRLQVAPRVPPQEAVSPETPAPGRARPMRVFWLAWLAGVLFFSVLGWMHWEQGNEPVEMIAEAQPTAVPQASIAPKASPLEPIADPVALIAPSPAAMPAPTAKPAKAKPRSKKATRYSEDLTDFLKKR